ncbi:MAG: glycine oxidase ThiO [Candidatus Eremiobacteraeota bacterium]|nr:glycine oxidase ThiO [Candidatus Eremiobacteraeota bacterium]
MIVVIGAGLIGLSVAYELAKRGADVRVLEAQDSAASPSWAGAGRLSPFTESDGGEEEELFLATALGTYQVFVKELHKRTGVDPYLRIDGIVEVALDEANATRLSERAASLVARGIHAHWLEPDEARRIEPSLGPHTLGASLIEDEGQIDNRQLGHALRLACVDAGVRLEERVGPVALETDGDRAVGVRAGDQVVAAEAVVNAAGAWAGKLPGVPPEVRIPLDPVRGQLLVLAMPRRLVTRMMAVPGAYLIPRTDGTLVIGEAVAEEGFEVRVDPFSTKGLRDAAVRALPALANLEIAETWAGLRPRSPNGRPFIGRTALEGYYVAAGHYRNALLLAPATALAVANVIEGKDS